jgi:hypothetical protein
MPPGCGQNLVPVRIDLQLAAGQLGQVPVPGVVIDIPLEEDDPVAAAGQRPAQRAPQRGVSVAPRGADREPKDHQFHRFPRGAHWYAMGLILGSVAAYSLEHELMTTAIW